MADFLQNIEIARKIVTPTLSVVAIWISVRALKITHRQARLAEEKASHEENQELTRVLLETKELAIKVAVLDDYIWKQRLFTRRQIVLDALADIRAYWKQNGETLRRHLGTDSRPYRALKGYYDVALQNENNLVSSVAPTAEWRGITEENLLGYTVVQAFSETAAELQRKRG